MSPQQPTTRLDSLDRYIVGVALGAAVSTVVTLWMEHEWWQRPSNWTAIAVFWGLLMIGELRSIAWLRLKDSGEVTPGWAFSFALLLLGSPSVAMSAMAVASAVPDLLRRKGLRRTIFNAAQTVVALFGATLVLSANGFAKPLTIDSHFSTHRMIAILAAGVTIFAINSVLTCVAIALNMGVSIAAVLRQASRLAISADGALLLLAPLFVIAADFSIATLPLLVLTAFLVYNSSREALTRDHRAGHDHLTELLNAPSFHEHVNAHLAAGSAVSARGCVMLLDIDGFKSLNDRLGHHIGDEVLRRVGDQLQFDRMQGAVAARLGGDEFAVFFPDVADVKQALLQAADVTRRLQAPQTVKGFPISISTSIGVVVLDSASSTSEELLRHADIAMYRAKRSHTGVEMYVKRARGDTSGGRISLLTDLVHAFERNELWLAYQPQVNAMSGRIEAFEALLRWNHPTLGVITPGDFVSMSEPTDLIDSITEHVLELACRDSAALMAIAPDIRIAVNVSTRNIRRRQFPRTVRRMLEAHDLAPHVLELELTESAFTDRHEVAAGVIAELREIGVRLAMDDFGSGYSSFSRLLQTSVDSLKIDRSMIQDLVGDDRNFLVIRTIIDLANALGVRAIAEGAEDMETVRQLRALGCHVVQGYAIAHPMTLPDAMRWLAEHPNGVDLSFEPATSDA